MLIHVQNASAHLEGDPGVISSVRPLVAYQEHDLPPVAVQLIVKGFMKRRKKRYGAINDLEAIFTDRRVSSSLLNMGWTREKLTPSIYMSMMNLPGVYDGWRSLVSSGGYFGTGLVPHVQRALELRLGVTVTIADHRVRPPARPGQWRMPSLWGFQREALDAWISEGCRGVINLPPRSGKTRIAIAAAIAIGLSTLFVVPTKQLVRQTVERFRDWLPEDQVVGVTGGRPNARMQRRMNNALVWVATPPTAAGPKPKKKNGVREGLYGIKTRCMLVIDEFHHAAADTWQHISAAAGSAYYRMGLTGTHYRADGKDLRMHSVLSRCVYRRSVSEMIELGRLVPAQVGMFRIPGDIGAWSGHEMYANGIVGYDYRNRMIATAANWLTHFGKRVLVIVKEVKHGENLAKLITGAVHVDGRDNEAVGVNLKRLERGDIPCLVGTSVIGEGVDVPAADALVYAVGGRSKVKVVQDFFRVLTASPGKERGIIVDFADCHHPKLLEASAHRLGLYRLDFDVDILDPLDLVDWLKRWV